MGDIITHTTKTGRVRYYARYVEVDGRRTSKATPAKTEEDAQKWLERAETRVAGGLPGIVRPKAPDRPRLTVKQLCEKFCGVVGDKKTDFATGYEGSGDLADAERYRRQAWSVLNRHVLDELGALDAGDVRRVDVMRMRDKWNDAKKPNTIVSRALRQLSRVFNWAIELEHIEGDNPVRGVKKPKCEGSTKFYTEAEMAKLLAWAADHDPTLHALIAFAFYTGCRKGEIAALRWSDIDGAAGRIIVQRSWKRDARKSGKAVVVSIHPHLAAILEARQQRTKGKGEALVFTDAAGAMLDKYELWGLDKAIAAKKLRRFRAPWHAFRHTHATQLAMGGAGLTAIRDALGQSTLHMAANYTHLAAEHIAAHVAKLPTLGPKAPKKVVGIDKARHARRGVDKGRITAEKEADIDSRVSADS